MISHRSARKLASPLVALVLVTAAQQAYAGEEDGADPKVTVAPPNAVAVAKAARSEGTTMRAVGLILAVGGGVGTVSAVYLATGPDGGGIISDKVGGYLIGAVALPMALTGIGFIISAQCKIARSDAKLQTLAVLPAVTPTSGGLALTGTF